MSGGARPARKVKIMMLLEKLSRLGEPVPLLAAFPYRVTIREDNAVTATMPGTARKTNAEAPMPGTDRVTMARDYSTSYYEECINPIFGKSRGDTRKDD